MSAYTYATVDHSRWADHPLEDTLYINKNKADGYKGVDDGRWGGSATVMRFVFDDGSRNTQYSKGYLERYEYNEVINPIVFELRNEFGVMHKMQNGNLVTAEDGDMKLVSCASFDSLYPVLLNLALQKLKNVLREKSIYKCVDYVRRILEGRFLHSRHFVDNLSPATAMECIGSHIAHECNVGYDGLLRKIRRDPEFSVDPPASITLRVDKPNNIESLIELAKDKKSIGISMDL